MSLVFDSIWRWREEFQAQGRGNLEGQLNYLSSPSPPPQTQIANAAALATMKNPHHPDSAAESSASSTHMDSTLMQPTHQMQTQLLAVAGAVTPNHGLTSSSMLSGNVGYSESNYEVFDPLNWMLDGLVDFPYSYAAVQGLEANSMS